MGTSRASDLGFLGYMLMIVISASLIAFCRRTKLPVYIAIVKALESMGDAKGMLNSEDFDSQEGQTESVATIRAIRSAAARAVTDPPRTMNSFWSHSW